MPPLRRVVLAFALMIVVGAPSLFLLRNHGLANLWLEGDITSGSAFGVRIGDDLEAAETRIARTGGLFDGTPGETCLGKTFANEELVSVHVEQSWRIRVVCLVSKRSKVTRILWRQGLVTP